MQIKVVERGGASLSDSSCLVVPISETGERSYGTESTVEDRSALEALASRGAITGKAQEVYFLPTPSGSSPYGGIAVLGLGTLDTFDAEVLRRSAGKACEILAAQRMTHAVFDGTAGYPLPIEAFVEGLMLGQYDFTKYKKDDEDPPARIDAITIVAASSEGMAELQEGCDRCALTCENTNWARDLANTSPQDMTPTALAGEAKAMAGELGCTCTILDEDEMAKLGMDALLSVSKGSSEPARLIVLEYTHEKASKTLAIVGKGVTFDSGGISIKPSEGMHEMKYDMCGAAAVLGAMKTVCRLKPEVNVVCIVPATENMPGSKATVPGDIVRAYNGKTIEIQNTDAEGRLILADALAYTIDKFNPDGIVDLATLTGACIAALGHYAAGVMATSDDLCSELQLAADASGERIWPLPLWKDYGRLMKGTHADLTNTGPKGEAGTITAGCFLQAFTGETPWAHLDIAGTAWGGKHIPYLSPDHATGYGVRLLTQWIRNESA